MPSIDREKARDVNWRGDHQLHRYVRIGGTIYYHEDPRKKHSQIAVENGAPEPKTYPYRPIVDDAGTIRVINNKLSFEGGTSSCDLRDNPAAANEETNQLARSQFGEDVVYP